jgi:hypothetical protein
MKAHLEGLRRLSPCCKARIGHPDKMQDRLQDLQYDPILVICLKCRNRVKEHILVNAVGERVWPILDTNLPRLVRRARRRRKTEADPIPYPLHLHDALAILRRKK